MAGIIDISGKIKRLRIPPDTVLRTLRSPNWANRPQEKRMSIDLEIYHFLDIFSTFKKRE